MRCRLALLDQFEVPAEVKDPQDAAHCAVSRSAHLAHRGLPMAPPESPLAEDLRDREVPAGENLDNGPAARPGIGKGEDPPLQKKGPDESPDCGQQSLHPVNKATTEPVLNAEGPGPRDHPHRGMVGGVHLEVPW